MKNRILDHFGLKVLSLVVAIIVWLIVANVDDYMTTKQISGIEIEFVNGNAITEKNKVYEVSEGTTMCIVVKGRRKIVEDLDSNDFKAVADLSKLSVTNAVNVEVSAINTSVARELSISTTNNTVVVAVEDKIKKQLPITVRANGEVAEGFAIRNKTATPNLITVEGAESVVNTIEGVVVDVDVNRIDHGLNTYATPIFIDEDGKELDSSKFTWDVDEIGVYVEVLQTKELEIKLDTVGTPKDGYVVAAVDYQPTSVKVVGKEEDLSKVDELVINDLDVADRSKDLETSINLADYLPEGITLAEDMSEVMVKVVIELIKEKRLAVKHDDINIVGKEEEYTYTFQDDILHIITVRGLADDLNELKISNMIPSIDVTGYEPGTYEFDVNFKEITGVELLEPFTVKVKIAKKK